MKLNVKRTVRIGVGFLSIMLIWTVYNWYMPLYLKDFFDGLFPGDDLLIGIIMALDNLFALFMVPLISRISDKTRSRFGRRIPFILVGLVTSAFFFILLPFVNMFGKVAILIADILLLLIAMNIYRSPTVSLMADITPKSVRGKANSIINIMGAVGVAFAYLSILLFGKLSDAVPFILGGIAIIVCFIVLFTQVDENKYIEEYEAFIKDHPEEGGEDEIDLDSVSKENKGKSGIILALLVVFFVYMANNSIETFMSLYSSQVFKELPEWLSKLPLDIGVLVYVPFGVATFAGAIPAGILGDKLGKSKIIFIGCLILAVAYLGISIIGYTAGFSTLLFVFFFIGGFGFAFVTINSYPLVVENCTKDNVGEYTGHYYTASMVAQSITPALCGLFVSNFMLNDIRFLFPYATIFIGFSVLVSLVLVRRDIAKKKASK